MSDPKHHARREPNDPPPGRPCRTPLRSVARSALLLALALVSCSGQHTSRTERPEGWPLPPGAGRIVSGYGARRGDHRHQGVDIAAPRGTPVLATAGGLIIFAGRRGGGYGRVVLIDHGDGWQTRYAHLAAVEADLADRVAKGDVIGRVGASGNAGSSHLHYEIRRYGRAIDPATSLDAAG